jgi:hypothetical protein
LVNLRLIDRVITVSDLRDPQKFLVFADIHEGAAGVDYDLLRNDISEVKNEENTHAFYLGDGTDAINKSDLKRFDLSSIHPYYIDKDHTERLAELARYQVKRLQETFNPIASKFIFATNGNHGEKYLKQYSFDPDREFAEYLQAATEEHKPPYVPGVCVLRLKFTEGKHTSRTFVVVSQHHCGGGSNSVDANLNWMQRILGATWSDANIYLVGHVHKRGVRPVSRISIPRQGKMRMEPDYQYYGVTGSYLKLYMDGVSSYAEGRYKPSDLGALRVVITPQTGEIHCY